MALLRNLFGKTETNKLTFKDGGELDIDAMLEFAWAAREMEFGHQHDNLKLRADDSLKVNLGELLNTVYSIRKEELGKLQLVHDGELKTINDIDQIWKFDLFDIFRHEVKKEKKFADNDVNLIIQYRPYRREDEEKDKSILKRGGTIIINLRIVGGIVGKTVYLQASINIPPLRYERNLLNGNSNQSLSQTLLLAYDHRTRGETEAEFDFIMEGIKVKANDEDTESLTKLEMDLLTHLHVSIARQYYSGKKAFTEHRYIDAIYYFNHVFVFLQDKWWKSGLTEEEAEILVESSFLMGFNYFELSAFEKALKYVEFAARSPRTKIKYKTEHLNVLIALMDIRAQDIMEYYLQELLEVGVNTWTEEHHIFYEFIMRRKTYLLIEMEDFEAAEKMLKDMLKENPDYDFAINELAYIEQLKKER